MRQFKDVILIIAHNFRQQKQSGLEKSTEVQQRLEGHSDFAVRVRGIQQNKVWVRWRSYLGCHFRWWFSWWFSLNLLVYVNKYNGMLKIVTVT